MSTEKSVMSIMSKEKTIVKGTANIGEDQIKFFEENDINFSKWMRKRLQAWVDRAKVDPSVITALKSDDDTQDNVKRNRILAHKTMTIDAEHIKFFKENKIEGKMSLLMRRTIDTFKDAIEIAEKKPEVAQPAQVS